MCGMPLPPPEEELTARRFAGLWEAGVLDRKCSNCLKFYVETWYVVGFSGHVSPKPGGHDPSHTY